MGIRSLSLLLFGLLCLRAGCTHVGETDAGSVPERLPFLEMQKERIVAFLHAPFSFEHGVFLFMLLYVVNYVIGRIWNRMKAKSVYSGLESALKRNFYALGIKGETMLKDSEHSYRFYASGRRNCKGLVLHLTLRTRQDLFSYITSFVYPHEDALTMDFILPDNMKPFVLIFCLKHSLKKMHTKLQDVNDYAVSTGSVELPPQWAILCDQPEVCPWLLTKSIVSALIQPIFSHLYISDQRVMDDVEDLDNIGNRSLQLKLRIPRDHNDLGILLETACRLVDSLAELRIPKESIERSLQKRRIAAETRFKQSHEERQEAVQEKKDEERRKRGEEYYKLTPEQRRKRDLQDEKDKQREQKKKLKMRTKLMR